MNTPYTEGFYNGMAYEQERIIKRIKEEQNNDSKVTLNSSSIDKLTEHWIAEGERIATERIIKLIKEFEDYESCYECGGFSFEDKLITLIKGETE